MALTRIKCRLALASACGVAVRSSESRISTQVGHLECAVACHGASLCAGRAAVGASPARWPGTDPAAAKAAARACRVLVARGEAIDPTSLTVRQAFDAWRANDLAPYVATDGTRHGRRDGGAGLAAQFSKHVFPMLGPCPCGRLAKATRSPSSIGRSRPALDARQPASSRGVASVPSWIRGCCLLLRVAASAGRTIDFGLRCHRPASPGIADQKKPPDRLTGLVCSEGDEEVEPQRKRDGRLPFSCTNDDGLAQWGDRQPLGQLRPTV